MSIFCLWYHKLSCSWTLDNDWDTQHMTTTNRKAWITSHGIDASENQYNGGIEFSHRIDSVESFQSLKILVLDEWLTYICGKLIFRVLSEKKLKGQNPFGKQSDEIMKRVCKATSRARTELGTSSLQRRCCLKKSMYGTATKRSITQRLCHLT